MRHTDTNNVSLVPEAEIGFCVLNADFAILKIVI